ncbi:Beta-galactosidase C-terminal domain [Streptomyces gilvus]|nr:Beta-galactosidase C-terminal domain [Streptomyces sp. CME 23]
MNHTDHDAQIPVSGDATELLSGKPATGSVTVPAGEVAVVREPR